MTSVWEELFGQFVVLKIIFGVSKLWCINLPLCVMSTWWHRSSAAWLLGVWRLAHNSTLQWGCHLDIVPIPFNYIPATGECSALSLFRVKFWVKRLPFVPVKGNCRFYVLTLLTSVTSLQMKVKWLELVKAIERSRMNKTQPSFMICILKVRFYGVNRSRWNSQTFWLV